jgi:23S rRNA (cytidine1920-2'-O)/16S rRNA (cytidine1409-2'-O)-methyltransferase
VAEQEGLEPPTPFRAAAFKAVSSSSQVCSTITEGALDFVFVILQVARPLGTQSLLTIYKKNIVDKMKNKERLDNILVSRAMFPSREAARTAIMDGAILVDGMKITKAGTAIGEGAAIEIIKSYNLCPYVSRGGLKMERALNYFGLDVKDRVAIDAGASTGGFTDCLLKNGTRFVYAVDVGHGQLDWSLRQDGRVKVLERVNIRNLKNDALYSNAPGGGNTASSASASNTASSSGGTTESVDINECERADLAVMDVSFISVTKTLPALCQLLSQRAYEMIVLIKPQFEAGRQKVGKGGVVRDFESHVEVLDKVVSFALALAPILVDLTYSPLKGPNGNIEYLLYLKGGVNIAESGITSDLKLLDWIRSKVEEAYTTLGAP